MKDNWLDSFGGFASEVANAAGQVADVFGNRKTEDIKREEAKADFKWQPIALALGGVVVVALVLKFAFRK
jgi:hypothetical protein